jgi:hypothetical protein
MNAQTSFDKLTPELQAQVMRKKLVDTINAAYLPTDDKPTWTPFELCEEMLKGVDLKGDILVLSDLGFIPVLKKRGVDLTRVTLVVHTDAQEKLARALMKVNRISVGRIWNVGYNSCIDELESRLVGLKFDIVVGNPPYGNLHLPILKKCVEHLTEDGVSITIQPVRWLQDPLWKLKKTTDAKKMQSTLDGKLDDVKIISSQEATRIFAATLNTDLGIFYVKNSGGKMSYDSLSKTVNGIDISRFERLIVENNLVLDSYDGQMKHFVPLATIAGSGSGRGFVGAGSIHQIYGYFTDGKSNQCKFGDGLTLDEAHKANKRRTFGKTIGAVCKQFDSADEARNFYEFIKLDVFRFFIYITTLDVNIQSRFLPFPKENGAFKTPWDASRFCEYFNITAEEEIFILKVMETVPPIS